MLAQYRAPHLEGLPISFVIDSSAGSFWDNESINNSSKMYWVQSQLFHLLNKDLNAYIRDVVRPR